MLGQDAFFISINEEIRTHLSSKYDTFAFISKKPLNKINNLESQKYDTLLFIYSNGNEKSNAEHTIARHYLEHPDKKIKSEVEALESWVARAADKILSL